MTPPRNYCSNLSNDYREMLLARMLGRIDATGDCWIWTGRLNELGYGLIDVAYQKGGRPSPGRAHNVLYELLIGPLPPDSEPDHQCRVPSCVNIGAHIEYVPHIVNAQRGTMRGGALWTPPDLCKNGHRFDGVASGRNGRPRRRCSECDRKTGERQRRRNGIPVRKPK